ncbi:MAG TPA: GNAT family N-acetyltransferase [Cellulomonas sp.]
MDAHSDRLTLHPFTAEEARRVVGGVAAETDRWAADYPFANEAVRLAVGIATAAGAGRVVAGTDPANLASQHVLAKAGFVEHDRTPDAVHFVLAPSVPAAR